MESSSDTATGSSNTLFFNGGKMSHIFEWSDDFRYKSEGKLASPEAEQALLHGDIFYKIDGANGMLQVVVQGAAPVLRAHERLDTKGKDLLKDKTNDKSLIPLPPGQNPSEHSGHSYVYEQVTTDVPGKKLKKRNQAMLDIMNRHASYLVGLGRAYISVEWVGRKFQQTPGVNVDVAMVIHEDQRLEDVEVERSYVGIYKFLWEDCADQPVEGLIFAHKGKYYKVISEKMAPPNNDKETATSTPACPFKTKRDKARAPIYLS